MLLNGPGLLTDHTTVGASYEVRRYYPIFLDFILCGKTLVGISAIHLPLYRRYFLGTDEDTRVRGWQGEVEEGEGIFLGSLELRRHISNIRYLTWNRAPIARRYFRNLKYGLSGGLFFDLGQTWIHPSEATSRKFQTGWGVGLHLHLPYLEVLRLEAGWSPDAKFGDAAISIRSRVAF
jgi:outer membrane protein assembly factor BamA